MKRLALVFLTILILSSCKKEKEEIPFIPQNYVFQKNEIVGVAKSYNSDGLISDNIEFNEDLFFMYINECYFMNDIKFNSDTLATFLYDDREDSIVVVKYFKNESDITFKQIKVTDPDQSRLHFVKSESIIKAKCTCVRLFLKESLSSFIFYGEMTTEYLQTLKAYLKANEKIYVQPFNVIYEQK